MDFSCRNRRDDNRGGPDLFRALMIVMSGFLLAYVSCQEPIGLLFLGESLFA
jgi:hypothetical protein